MHSTVGTIHKKTNNARKTRFCQGSKSKTLVLVMLLILSTPFCSIASAQVFDFTFDKLPGTTYGMECNNGGVNFGCTGLATSDDTRFLQATGVIIGEDTYIHQIVGDPSTGFAQEIFVMNSRLAGANLCGSPSCATSVNNPSLLNVNPTAAAMKLLINEVDGTDSFSSVYLKDRLDYRAKIQQDISSGSMIAQFEVDARHLDLLTLPTEEVPMINFVNIDDTSIPTSFIGPDTNFDMNIDSDMSVVDLSMIDYRWNSETGEYEFADPFP